VNRRIVINLIFFNLVFVVMVVWAVNNIVTIDAIERPYTLTADFAQAAGVRSNSEVTYLGVHYGRVTGVVRRDEGVRATMKIDRHKQIPEGSIARIFRKSAIGEPYVDFQPPASFDAKDVHYIKHDERIPESRTTVPLEFSDLLRSAGALIGSIDPNKAGSLVHELSLALDGRGPALRDLTTGFDAITATLAARTDALDRLAVNNTRITGVLADHRLSLGQSISNLRAVTEALRDSKGDLQSLLETGPKFLTVTADLVADQKQNLDCLLTDLAPTLRLASSPDKLTDLAQLLEKGPTGFGYVFDSVDREPDGPWIRVNLMVDVTGTPAKVYTPRATLPVVPTVSPCGSTLRPAAVAPGPSTALTARSGTTATPSTGTGSVAAAAASPPTRVADVVRSAAHPDRSASPMAVLALVLLAGAVATLLTKRPVRDAEDR
jgi:phospholipid/cholesterol/gamma-HCH transport system substrate-binding protein